MIHRSVLLQIILDENTTESSIKKQVAASAALVTEGRYLISLFEAPNSWESRLPIEAYIVSEVLGPIEERNENWEFFGNGAIRSYKHKGSIFNLDTTYQWNILRRSGDKPYSRRHEVSAAFLKKNMIPVSDKVFTRDVANNVWQLRQNDLFSRIIARFSSLLTWQDEEFIHIQGSRRKVIQNRQKLILKDDLVGVPTKIPYMWNSGDKLF
jgi:hypothetical protein